MTSGDALSILDNNKEDRPREIPHMNSQSTISTVAHSTTRSKLENLNERLVGFEKQIENDMRSKREHDEARLIQLKDNLYKLEKSFSNEVKRRVDACKSLQMLCEDHVQAIEQRFQSTFMDKVTQLQGIVSSLSDRLDNIEKDLEKFKKNKQKVEREQMEYIRKELSDLKNTYEMHREERVSREKELDRRLQDIETSATQLLTTEKRSWEETIQSLSTRFDDLKKSRSDNDTKFENFLMEEISNQKNSLLLEAQAREMADDDIVQAVNHYTAALQDALQLVN